MTLKTFNIGDYIVLDGNSDRIKRFIAVRGSSDRDGRNVRKHLKRGTIFLVTTKSTHANDIGIYPEIHMNGSIWWDCAFFKHATALDLAIYKVGVKRRAKAKRKEASGGERAV